MADTTQLERTVLQACREDHVGLWELVRIVERGALGGNLMRETIGLLRRLLSEGAIRAGEPAPDGRSFLPWESDLEETLSRIEFEWRRLRRRPTLGEIVWFEATPKTSPGPPSSRKGD